MDLIYRKRKGKYEKKYVLNRFLNTLISSRMSKQLNLLMKVYMANHSCQSTYVLPLKRNFIEVMLVITQIGQLHVVLFYI